MLPVADKKMSSVIGSGDDEDGDDEPEQVNILEETNTFDDIVIWGHETLPDDMDDPYVKGIEEWIPFAEAVSEIDIILWLLLMEGGRCIRTRRQKRILDHPSESMRSFDPF